LIIGLAVVWMASAPSAAWSQSAVWFPQGATTGNIYYNGGNVGIGTTAPNAKLEVWGPGDNNDLTPREVLRLTRSANTNQYLQIKIGPDPGAGHGYGYSFVPRGYNGSSYVDGSPFFIEALGNVGIGTTAPQYKLAVNGTIGAKEVIVTNIGWSDYVFRPGYRLRPLSEVGAYIRAHRHLPGIPSEAEVKEKGVSLGEMQAKLLAKIEELTLHMIQQEKENRELRERLARLETRAAGSGALAVGR
jgi:hypothetical protein